MSFPDHFLWGTATSAYQIEGATKEGGRGPSNWDVFAARPGNILNGDTADIAADHYHRVEEDLDLMARLGVSAYRFSLSWTRLHPEGRRPLNPEGAAFYDRLVDGLLERGIKPLVTINHMEIPESLDARGGWLERDTIERFTEYAVDAHRFLKDRVDCWATMNEVAVTTWWGHATRMFPPALGDQRLVMPAIHHQLVAHGRAVHEMRRVQPTGEFGMVGSYWPTRASRDGEAHRQAAETLDLLFNRSCLDVLVDGAYPQALLDWHTGIGGQPFIEKGDLKDISAPLDYFGLNYYAPLHVCHDPTGPGGTVVPEGIDIAQEDPPEAPRTAFDWVIDADAMLPILRLFRDRYRLPVLITENGAAFDDVIATDGRVHDTARIHYLRQHLTIIEQAIAEGIDIRGYMAWSLLDNFEWAAGYSKRFGLTYIDYASQQRLAKESFHWYASVIRANALSV